MHGHFFAVEEELETVTPLDGFFAFNAIADVLNGFHLVPFHEIIISTTGVDRHQT